MPGWPDVDADSALREATFRLETPTGGFAGTGFLADAEGRLITCHHVTAAHPVLKATDRTGRSWQATPESLDDVVLCDADIAILRLSEPSEAAPLPLSFREPGPAFASRVQLADAMAFRDATPLEGELLGASQIAYRHGARTYRVEGRAVKAAKVLGGMSGAAAWDPHTAAVVGVLAVSAASDPNFGGFAIPFEQARASARLVALVEANEAAVPRYGDRPNRLGLMAQLDAGTAEVLARLKARGIVPAAAHITREGWEEKLSAFLASPGTALAIVSAAGQGKTNLLVQVAERRPKRPAWLVRAADFKADEAPAAGLNRLLSDISKRRTPVWPSMGTDCDLAPILLLDGLNEAPLAEARIAGEWMPDLLAEAQRSGWRVIYTTRRELFAALRELGPSDSFALGRYSPEEAEAAAKAYGVDGQVAEREPLLLRIRAEVGAGASRAEVLGLFVRRLLRTATVGGRGGHPEALLDRLAELAERTARNANAAPYDDPFFADAALTEALCEANLLEEMPAGYRFVFDEVADYLHARHLVGVMKTSDGAVPTDAHANVLSLVLEILGARSDVSAAEQVATQLLGDLARAGPQRLQAFATISRLPSTPHFLSVKVAAAKAVADDDAFVRGIIRQADTLAGFLPAALAPIIRAAIVQQQGYGWREKDVWSDVHRQSLVSSARLEFGIFRVIIDLLDDDRAGGARAGGAQMLIDLLADATALAEGGEKYGNSEATVGSFALCMLYAHRDRVGVQRLFDEVLLAERRGWGSLMEALAAEETTPFVEWLETINPRAAAQRLAWTTRAWREALPHLREAEGAAGSARAARALTALIPHLDTAGLGELLETIVLWGLPVEQVVPLIRRAAEAGALSYAVLGSAYRQRQLELDDILELAGPDLREKLVWSLVGSWKPDDRRPPLPRLVELIRGTGRWPANLDAHRFDLESLLYRVELDEARDAGFCDLVEGLLARDDLLGLMGYPAFDERPTSPGQREFRLWLARLVRPRMTEQERVSALKSLINMEPAILALYEPVLADMLPTITSDNLLGACISQNALRPLNLAALIEGWFGLHGRRGKGPDADLLSDLLMRLRSADPPDTYAVFNLAIDHINATRGLGRDQ